LGVRPRRLRPELVADVERQAEGQHPRRHDDCPLHCPVLPHRDGRQPCVASQAAGGGPIRSVGGLPVRGVGSAREAGAGQGEPLPAAPNSAAPQLSPAPTAAQTAGPPPPPASAQAAGSDTLPRLPRQAVRLRTRLAGMPSLRATSAGTRPLPAWTA